MGGFGAGSYGALAYGAAVNEGDEVVVAPQPIRLLVFTDAVEGLRRVDFVYVTVTPIGGAVVNRVMWVANVNGIFELIWTDAAGFTDAYVRGSVRIGNRFALRRQRGWQSGIINVQAIGTDLAGNLVKGQSS